jgi:hypothetical protein
LENNLNKMKMKNNYLKNSLLLGLILVINMSCERNLSDEAIEATFSKTAEIFIDTPVEMGTNFYFPYSGSKPNAWSVDTQVSYKGSASMRFDIPNATDPEGNYAGAIFRVDGAGRNLTDYDALTFYAKASQGVTISEFGFGEDFFPNKYVTTMTNVSVGTTWAKYTIPIPDASKLLQERGMFRYAAGTQGTNGLGYILWIDELKFEKLGTILPLQTSIMNGNNVTQNLYVGVNSSVNGFSARFNMANGLNQSVTITPSFFNFSSSNPAVASVNELGEVTVLAAGSTVITATFGNQPAVGSLTINSLGNFNFAPTPTRPAANVTSIFSDAYTNVPVQYYNGYWGGSTTQGQNDITINGDNVIRYTQLNYVGIQFANPTVNATSRTHFHIDLLVDETLNNGDFIRIEIVDFGSDGVFGGGNDTTKAYTSGLQTGVWKSFDLPFTSFTGNSVRSNLAQVILVSNGTISNILVDNIYFYNN